MKPAHRHPVPRHPVLRAKPLRKLAVCALATLLAVLAPHGTLAATSADEVPAPVTEALQSALSLPDSRMEVLAWKLAATSRCTPEVATVDRPLTGSGRYAVKLEGPGCGIWGWATVRVFAPAYVTTRPVRAGDSLADAVKAVDREIRAGRPPASVNAGAKAARALPSGQLVEAAHLEAGGPKAGAPIKVLVRSGSLGITQYGRAVSCGRGRVCAVLPSGKHVEGNIEGETLVVEMQ